MDIFWAIGNDRLIRLGTNHLSCLPVEHNDLWVCLDQSRQVPGHGWCWTRGRTVAAGRRCRTCGLTWSSDWCRILEFACRLWQRSQQQARTKLTLLNYTILYRTLQYITLLYRNVLYHTSLKRSYNHELLSGSYFLKQSIIYYFKWAEERLS